MQVESIVPGQYMLEDFKDNLITLHKRRLEIFAEAKNIIDAKINYYCGNINIGYLIAMKHIAEKILKNKADEVELRMFRFRRSVMGGQKNNREVANEMIDYVNERLKNVSMVYSYYDKLIEDVNSAQTLLVLDQEMNIFRNTIAI